MKKPTLSGKTIFKLMGALLALMYLAFCLYAGITERFPAMHQQVHIMRFGEVQRWVSSGMSAILIGALFLNSALHDWNRENQRKDRFLPLFLTMILPIILLLLLEAYLDIGWLGIGLYAAIAALLFAIAWIPQILQRQITRLLLRKDSLTGRQQAQIIDWIHFYPLKKLLILGLWGFGALLVPRGLWVTFTGEIELDGEFFLFLLGTAVLTVVFFPKMKHYVCTPYPSIPGLNRHLSKQQLEALLEGERFAPVAFEEETMAQYLNICRSQNWMLIGGKLLSKKLALQATMVRYNSHTVLNVLYLNGESIKTTVDLALHEERYHAFTAVLAELTGGEGPLELRGREDQLAQKFAACFPEISSEPERLAAFLTQDAAPIRQDYHQTFSPPPPPPRKKCSRRPRA